VLTLVYVPAAASYDTQKLLKTLQGALVKWYHRHQEEAAEHARVKMEYVQTQMIKKEEEARRAAEAAAGSGTAAKA
jgi:hypothetical protein